jgi:hypothetical protein
VLSLLQSGDAAAQQGKVVLVDLRRNDHEVSVRSPGESRFGPLGIPKANFNYKLALE